jgi:methyl-accepting chemotaxis protein
MSMERLDKTIDKTQSSMRDCMQIQSEKTEKIGSQIESAAETLRHVSNTTNTVNTAVMSFRTLALHLLQT